MEGCFESISLKLVVKLSWTSFEVEVGSTHRILKHGRRAILRGEMGMNGYLDYIF
jgi:hypothetical protein